MTPSPPHTHMSDMCECACPPQVIRVLRYHIMAHCGDAAPPQHHHVEDAPAPPPALAEDAAAALLIRHKQAAAEELVVRVVLPASMMVASNVALAGEVWCLVSLFPYNTRFRFYGEVKVCGGEGGGRGGGGHDGGGCA